MKKTTQSDFFVYIPKTGFSNEDCRVRRFSAYFDISILDHLFCMDQFRGVIVFI